MPPLERREYLTYVGSLVGAPALLREMDRDDENERDPGAGPPGNPLSPTGLEAEHESAPNNVPPFFQEIDDPAKAGEPYAPRFTWRIDSDTRNGEQSAYHVLVASAPEILALNIGDVWDSGRVESAQSTTVPYGGPFLEPEGTYYWKVRVWDGAGDRSSWSEPARFTVAIPDTADHWEGTWIGNHPPTGPAHEPSDVRSAKHQHSPLLRKGFTLEKEVESARAHVITLGYGELYANGSRVGDDDLNPAWTAFDRFILYSTYDIGDRLSKGENALGLWLGRGWFSKTAEWPASAVVPGVDELPQYPTSPVASSWDSFGPPRALLQVNVTYEDGTNDSVASDTSWMAIASPITENDLWDGETYDARKEQPGWAEPGFDKLQWAPATEMFPPNQSDSAATVNANFSDTTDDPASIDDPMEGLTLRPQRIEPIRVTETIEPVTVQEHGDGYIVEFNQNFAGWIELAVRGASAGDRVNIQYAELLAEDGSLDTRSNRKAEADDAYIAKGDGEEVYEPRFTYHGFRYVRIDGYPGDLRPSDVTGKVVHTDYEQRGSFACSNEDLNQVQQNSEWGLRSNAHSVPTDCPQRDERHGWTGTLTERAELYNFDATRYLEKWIRDHTVNLGADGSHSDTIPGAYGWRDADPNWAKTQVLVPWWVYLHSGDERVLETAYEDMRAYVDYWDGQADGHVVPAGKMHYGDHVAPGGPRQDPALLNTFAHYQTTDLFATIAAELSRDEEASTYRERAEAIGRAFNDEFFDPDSGTYGSGNQATYALPLAAGIVPEDHEERVLENFVTKIVEEDGGKLQTGGVSTRPMLFTLVEHGHADLAYHVVSQPEQPGWVYMIRDGATALWETWNNYERLESGGVLTSFNHRLWQEVSEWFYRVVAGIDIVEAGFEHVSVAPHVVGDLDWAEGSVDTIRGTVASRWERTDAGLTLDVTVPWNASATVRVPDLGDDSVRLREGGEVIWDRGDSSDDPPEGVSAVSRDQGRVIVEVGAGEYAFELVADDPEGPDGPVVPEPLEVSGSRSDDGSAFTGGQTNQIDLSIDANRPVTVRDVLPAGWEVVGGDDHEVYEEDGTQYIEFSKDLTGGTGTYFAEAPSGPQQTGEYTFGPIEVTAGEEWVMLSGTADTNTVVGPDTNV